MGSEAVTSISLSQPIQMVPWHEHPALKLLWLCSALVLDAFAGLTRARLAQAQTAWMKWDLWSSVSALSFAALAATT